MKKRSVIKPKIKIKDLKHETVPATVGLVKKVRDELRADIRSVDHKVDSLRSDVGSLRSELKTSVGSLRSDVDFLRSDVGSLRSDVDFLRSDVGSLRSDVGSLRSELKTSVDSLRSEIKTSVDSLRSELKASVEQVMVSVHRTQVLMEEQRGENRIVLDGIKSVMERQDRVEHDVSNLQKTVNASM